MATLMKQPSASNAGGGGAFGPVRAKSLRAETLCKSDTNLLFDREGSLISPRFVKTPSFSNLPIVPLAPLVYVIDCVMPTISSYESTSIDVFVLAALSLSHRAEKVTEEVLASEEILSILCSSSGSGGSGSVGAETRSSCASPLFGALSTTAANPLSASTGSISYGGHGHGHGHHGRHHHYVAPAFDFPNPTSSRLTLGISNDPEDDSDGSLYLVPHQNLHAITLGNATNINLIHNATTNNANYSAINHQYNTTNYAANTNSSNAFLSELEALRCDSPLSFLLPCSSPPPMAAHPDDYEEFGTPPARAHNPLPLNSPFEHEQDESQVAALEFLSFAHSPNSPTFLKYSPLTGKRHRIRSRSMGDCPANLHPAYTSISQRRAEDNNFLPYCSSQLAQS